LERAKIETHIKPLLGKALVHTLKIADIERIQSDIVDGKTAKSFNTQKRSERTRAKAVGGKREAGVRH
jgi:hypothetical protein